MVVMNKNATTTPIDLKRFTELLKDKSSGTNVITGEIVSLQNTFTAPAKTVLVLEIK